MMVENGRQATAGAAATASTVTAPVVPVVPFTHCTVLVSPRGTAAMVFRTVSQSEGATTSAALATVGMALVGLRSGPNGSPREEQPATPTTNAAAAMPPGGRAVWRRFCPPL